MLFSLYEGRREKDMRQKYSADDPEQLVESKAKVTRSQGAARAISTFIDPSLNWNDVKWFRSITKMPILLKGVQTADDAVLAARHGCQGVVLSNHGGRQLDFAPSGIEILPEVMEALKAEGLDKNFEVYVDGGIRRGTDIFKAIALGAKGVGIGRPALVSLKSFVKSFASSFNHTMAIVCHVFLWRRRCGQARSTSQG